MRCLARKRLSYNDISMMNRLGIDNWAEQRGIKTTTARRRIRYSHAQEQVKGYYKKKKREVYEYSAYYFYTSTEHPTKRDIDLEVKIWTGTAMSVAEIEDLALGAIENGDVYPTWLDFDLRRKPVLGEEKVAITGPDRIVVIDKGTKRSWNVSKRKARGH